MTSILWKLLAVVCWLILNLPQVLMTVGLLLDVMGAWFVAWEVVRTFQGEKYERMFGRDIPQWGNKTPVETEEYQGYQQRKYNRMWVGLILLTVGFAAQILAAWI